VNGFTLLCQPYDATEPAFDGHVSVPTPWDGELGIVVSNEYRTMGIDLATQFRHLAQPVVDTYPAELADDIEVLDRWLGPVVNQGVRAASHVPARASCCARRSWSWIGASATTGSSSLSASPRPTSGCS
jgi:glutathionyl-hydroquinone reductase